MQNKPVLAVTNPLHYVYYRQRHPIAAVASTHGIMQEYGSKLGFIDDVSLYDVANGPQALIEADARPQAAYISWKPVPTTAAVLGNTYQAVHKLEQKSVIRELLPRELFPSFITIDHNDIAALTYDEVAAQLQSPDIVMQIDDSTGGKGTFFVSNAADFNDIHAQLINAAQPIVASKRVRGTSRALQCLLLDGQLYMTPWWHRDLVGIAGVCDMTSPHATRYAGAVLENIPASQQPAVNTLAQAVADGLNQQAYQGIFGIDIVVDDQTNQLYLIEINPRFTAVSHLYATAMRAVGYQTDFLTAHVERLVQGGVEELDDLRTSRALPVVYFYLKLQNTSSDSVVLSENCSLGVHDEQGNFLRFGWGIDALQADDEVVIIPEVARSSVRQPGERTYSLIGTGEPLRNGVLDTLLQQQLQRWHERFLQAAA
jgi:hypothetical protein